MKEAYVKAVGVGLGFELHRAEFHYDKDMIWGDLAHVYIDGIVATEWQFFLHKLDPEHWVSLQIRGIFQTCPRIISCMRCKGVRKFNFALGEHSLNCRVFRMLAW